MQRDPSLRQEPKEPDPGVLIGDDFGKKIAIGTIPIQIRWNSVRKHARIANPQAAKGNQERNCNWNSQVYWKSVAETLDWKKRERPVSVE